MKAFLSILLSMFALSSLQGDSYSVSVEAIDRSEGIVYLTDGSYWQLDKTQEEEKIERIVNRWQESDRVYIEAKGSSTYPDSRAAYLMGCGNHSKKVPVDLKGCDNIDKVFRLKKMDQNGYSR